MATFVPSCARDGDPCLVQAEYHEPDPDIAQVGPLQDFWRTRVSSASLGSDASPLSRMPGGSHELLCTILGSVCCPRFCAEDFCSGNAGILDALLLDMPRPYLAMTLVYITANRLTGATWSKAVYRILGTLIGAAGTIALIPNLVNAPELLSLVVALWLGTFLYFSMIDGTPRG